MAQSPLAQEKIWFDKPKYDEAERKYYEKLAKLQKGSPEPESNMETVAPQAQNNTASKKKREGGKNHKKNQNNQNQQNNVPNNVLNEESSAPLRVEQVKDVPPPTEILAEVKEKSPVSDEPDNDKQSQGDLAKKDNNNKKKKSRNFKKEKKQQQQQQQQPQQQPPQPQQQQPQAQPVQAPTPVSEEVAPTQPPVSSLCGLPDGANISTLAGEVAKARLHIKSSLDCINGIAVMAANNVNVDVSSRINSLEKENSDLKNTVSKLTDLLKKLELRVVSLEKGGKGGAAPAPAKSPKQAAKPAAKPAADDDDDVDLFGSDSEEDAAAQKIKEERLAAYAAKKSKKPALIAKSNIIFDVKPWDDETDMKVMEEHVRKITLDGLIWGASKLVPLAYGIKKLQISCVVEDDKVSVDELQEKIEANEDYVQSVDIAAFNKV